MGISKNSARELARFQKMRECLFLPVGQDARMKPQHAARPSPPSANPNLLPPFSDGQLLISNPAEAQVFGALRAQGSIRQDTGGGKAASRYPH